LDSEGRSLLYAVRAAVTQYPSLSSRYALLGHSQGGHAAIGAAELANTGEITGLTLVGAAALAPASQVSAQGAFLAQVANNPAAPLTDRVNAAVGRIAFSGLILAGIEAVDPSFDDAGSYGSDGGFIPDLVASQCTATIFSDLLGPVQSALGSTNSIESILPSDVEDDTRVASYLEELEPGFREIAPPVLLVQGDQDTTVFPSSTQQLLNNMNALGNRVSLDTISGADHQSVLVSSLVTTILFLDDQFANAP
jgi:pimeloyl-ACP methyl ester carboxylesterase